MTRMPILLAVVGLAGTGKSEVTGYIKERYGYQAIYFGGYVLEEIKTRNLEVNSQNERLVREDLRRQHGMDVIARLSAEDIRRGLDGGHNIVIDGLYSYSEYRFLKELAPGRFYTLAVHAYKEMRYERLGRRSYRPLTPAEIDDRDMFELANLEKCPPIVLADYHVVNEGSIGDLRRRIDAVFDLLEGG